MLLQMALFHSFLTLKNFIYLFLFLAASGLRRSMRDILLQRVGSSLWHAGFSLVVACGFSLSSCGTRAAEHVGSVACGVRAQ